MTDETIQETPTTEGGSQEAAAAQITAMTRDAGFRQRFLSGDRAARAEWDAAVRAKAGVAQPASSTAAERVEALKNDGAFRAKLLVGDVEARAEWQSALEAAAAPVASDQSAPIDAPTQIDEIFPPATDPSQFRTHPLAEAGVSREDVRQFAEAAISARLDPSSGSDLMRVAAETEKHLSTLTAAEFDQWAVGEYGKLVERIGGGSEETLKERLAPVKQMLADLDAKHPGVKDRLHDAGLLDDAKFVSRLVRHTERQVQRQAELQARGAK